MQSFEPPVRTHRAFEDNATFQEIMGERLKQSPWLVLSAALHAVALLLLWVFLPPDGPKIAKAKVTLAQQDKQEIVQPKIPEKPEVDPEVDPDVTPIDDVQVSENETDNPSDADSDSEQSTESAFDSNQWNTAVGMGPGAAGRYSGRGKRGGKGTGSETPIVVTRGLEWLAAHQDENGQWDSDGFMKHDDPAFAVCSGPGNAVHDIGITGLALLAFLGENNTLRSGKYRDTVRRGVKWLRSQQDPETGLFGGRYSHDFVYDHAIAAYAMCEAFGLSDYRLLRKTAQLGLNYLESHRNAYSVWRYQPQDQDNDISVTAWAVMAYESGKYFGLQVNDEALKYAATFLDQVSDETGRHGYRNAGEPCSRKVGDHGVKFPAHHSEALTAVGLFCRFFLGQDPREQPVMNASANLLTQKLPVWDEAAGSIDHYYWYYATYALFQKGGTHWKKWQRAIEKAVCENQHGSKDDKNLFGSWDPVGAWGDDGGRVYSTAILTLTMQANYRYTPLLR